MIHLPFIAESNALPKAGDLERVRLGWEKWQEAVNHISDPALAEFANNLTQDTVGRRLLESVFGNSPYLSQSLLAEIAFLQTLLQNDPDTIFTSLLNGLEQEFGAEDNQKSLMTGLRRGKRQAALLIALADIANLWPVEKIIINLSIFAETTLKIALDHLLRQAAGRGDFTLKFPQTPARGTGLFIIGMGKLGARELNYSSDIDLIVLFENDKLTYTGKRSLGDCFVKLTQGLIQIMNERTADGYVFRTDLRLRPDPGSTPIAISTLAAETYYETAGQNWERAALIKARIVAGDAESGERFLKYLTPFMWRKHLDFAAIDDIHSIKRQINAHKGLRDIKVAGQNVKLGPGGIREIEFFAQTQQLIWGGRETEMRVGGTFPALNALVVGSHLKAEIRDQLFDAYRFLRRVEHRLQMTEDRQTHLIPESEEGWHALAVFLGYDDADEFAETLLSHLRVVEKHYGELFGEAPSLGGLGNLVFTGAENDPETLDTLNKMGFSDVTNIATTIRNWHHSRYHATRSERARQILTELMPALLTALSQTTDPDTAFMKFDEFLSRLPAGIQLFSLFHSNPALLDLVAEIMGSSPRLADRLSRRSILLDGVLSQGFFDSLPPQDVLRDELHSALALTEDFEEVLNISRRWAKDRKFQLGVQMLRGTTDAEAAAPHFSNIGDILFQEIQPLVEKEFSNQYGVMPKPGLAVIAMGKLGSREMTVASDIDMIFIYENQDENDHSSGERSLDHRTYFSRLSQRIINAMTAHTVEGELYEVDMRLRPSGESGPIASSLESFRRYQTELAWVWEHMALTRARVINGPSALGEQINQTIHDILTLPRDPEQLVFDVADMRAKIAEHFPGDEFWNIKFRRGGIIDIEFIAQYLQLKHAHKHPEILSTNTITTLTLAAEKNLISREECKQLVEGAGMWHRIQGLLRMCFKEAFTEEKASIALRQRMASTCGAVDFDELKTTMERIAEGIAEIFNQQIIAPAQQAETKIKPKEDIIS
ncbi:MAG: bifunctional [glutamine synthetase] adenylyltransferase/[glutamine synthetase]-adenylyl-L-tyrosine phosphorylase [Rhodospirillaceae bacterium]|jgi:[glutamine synthetase] adenylyltransferase / [glutamine synthetase]-adenylyl-L-tyrosine phosphorylase|nr:bifunctional [glutamine synthetase] adenylyltransferase/[glutamine synthetase]-adenylyl-L-tyrosine phosphorylase [Rhodospirillaceae bacterium]MBT5374251.1 bifunctional [glutamine synthetase] adenylyltransferase/[glutamine synthetase]-adenylyl-L-tyrosine phosphorylase [Rhodospirillaceae bacterium]MBT5660420.1 bifunctional [glutamine synthetase] adenylyltransferase/[glutamine synthetase]-adenylyl-L-tyrosine phosphorylase [Rhodospirillaceae bacterium]